MNTRAADGLLDMAAVDDEATLPKRRRSFSAEGIAQSLRNFATLSEALRILGAAVMVASMSVFLLKGWSAGNDIHRYLLLLAQSGLLTAAGFAMSHGLRETRGARIFFGLALVSIPANFTILGALLYSVLQWDAGLVSYPGYAHWQIDSLAGTGATFAGAMLVLIPVTLFCFAIMARRSARTLTLHFLIVNSLLLLPIRSSVAAGTVALLGVAYALFVVGKLSRTDRSLKTGEGRFALATLFIPLGIVLFRSMYFYRVDSLMIAMVSMAVYLAARQVSLFPDRSPRIGLALDALSAPVALIVAVALADALAPVIGFGFQGPVLATIYSGLALDILRRTGTGTLSRLVGISVSVVAALGFCFGVATRPGALTAILCLGAGAVLLVAGVSLRRRAAAVSGIVTLLAGGIFGLGEILWLIMASSWIDLAIFGACAIVLGSVVDRHGVVIKLRLVRWFDDLGVRRARDALDDQPA